MIIRYDYLDDVMISIPSDAIWEIKCTLDNKMNNYGLYLVVNGAEYFLQDTDIYCQGRDLPDYEVKDLYGKIIEKVVFSLLSNPNLNYIDINTIETQLLEEKFEKRWAEKGYIKIDEHGSW